MLDPAGVFQCGKDKIKKHFLRRQEDPDRSKECTSWTTVGLAEYYFLSSIKTDVYSTLDILFQALAWHRGGSQLICPSQALVSARKPWNCCRYWDRLGRAVSSCIQAFCYLFLL